MEPTRVVRSPVNVRRMPLPEVDSESEGGSGEEQHSSSDVYRVDTDQLHDHAARGERDQARAVPQDVVAPEARRACSCCGETKATVALGSRDDVELCRDCLEWLLGRIGMSSMPTLPVVDIAEAIAFYERAGFGVPVYADDDGEGGDGFGFVDFDGQSVFDLDAACGMDPAENRAGCYIVADDAERWHARMLAAELAITPIADQPWGTREFTLTDPSGNHVRIGRSIPDGG